ICLATLSPKQCSPIGRHILFCPVHDGEQREIAGHSAFFFDIHSHKAKQFGFRLVSPEGQVIVCTGDEPLNELCRPVVREADWLLHESFCLEKDDSVFHPHDIGHGTVAEAARTAQLLNVKNLVLWHTEDSVTYGTRKALYCGEAKKYFSGRVFVPEDLEVIPLR
ncbi:MAG: MBL fold metallo-hydrolase, partial [Mailhella sp.]|nr:MBL fold metallo-hydrolase [Mailhella sp.]